MNDKKQLSIPVKWLATPAGVVAAGWALNHFVPGITTTLAFGAGAIAGAIALLTITLGKD